MSLPVFPTILPKVSIGLTANVDSSVIRTRMESGRTRQRRRFTTRFSRFNVSWICNYNELQIFAAFFEYYLNGGQAWFKIDLPSFGNSGMLVQQPARFINGVYAVSSRENDFVVSAELEVENFNLLSVENAQNAIGYPPPEYDNGNGNGNGDPPPEPIILDFQDGTTDPNVAVYSAGATSIDFNNDYLLIQHDGSGTGEVVFEHTNLTGLQHYELLMKVLRIDSSDTNPAFRRCFRRLDVGEYFALTQELIADNVTLQRYENSLSQQNLGSLGVSHGVFTSTNVFCRIQDLNDGTLRVKSWQGSGEPEGWQVETSSMALKGNSNSRFALAMGSGFFYAHVFWLTVSLAPIVQPAPNLDD